MEPGTRQWTKDSPEGKLILMTMDALTEYASQQIIRGRSFSFQSKVRAYAEVATSILGMSPSVEDFERVTKQVFLAMPRDWWGIESELRTRKRIVIADVQMRLHDLAKEGTAQ